MQLISRLIPLIPIVFLSACTTITDVRGPRNDDYSESNIRKRQDIEKSRTATIADNETFFTNRLRCLGTTKIMMELQPRISVAPIYDKTGKVYPAGSTAISDIALNSLSYIKGLRIVETPLSGDLSESRVNLLSDKYLYLSKGIKDNIAIVANKLTPVPYGVIFPSQLHITGALVRYDEGTETLSPTINLNIDAFAGMRQVETITVGLQLRLINSGDGEVLTNHEAGKRGSVLLTNKFYKVQTSASLFRLIRAKQFGIDYSVAVADPQQYVIQEMLELGIAELLSVLPGTQHCK